MSNKPGSSMTISDNKLILVIKSKSIRTLFELTISLFFKIRCLYIPIGRQLTPKITIFKLCVSIKNRLFAQ